MSRRLAPISLALGLSLLALAPVARADVAPPEACTAQAGLACNNAGGAKFDNAGNCVNAKCGHMEPGPDGGLVEHDYACVLCSKSAGTGGSNGGDASSGGCAVGRVGGDVGLAGLLLAVGALAVARVRKR